MEDRKKRRPWRIPGIILGILIGLIASGWLYTLIVTPHIERRLPPEGTFVTVDDINLHVVREGSGPPVVLLHCGGCTMNYFTNTPLYPLLAESYDTIVFDRYGAGHSDISADAYTTPTEQAALIHSALTEMEVEKAVFVGSSSGGTVALAYALSYPEDVVGLVLIGAWMYPGYEPTLLSRTASIPLIGDIFIDALVTPIGHAFLALSDNVSAPDPVPSPEYVDSLKLILRPNQFRASLAQETGWNNDIPGLSTGYGKLSMPVVAIAGDQDDLSIDQNEHLADDVPQARIVIVENAGHFPYFGQPEIVYQAIESIWAAVE